MFNKIKNKFKKILNKSEEIIEENQEEIIENKDNENYINNKEDYKNEKIFKKDEETEKNNAETENISNKNLEETTNKTEIELDEENKKDKKETFFTKTFQKFSKTKITEKDFNKIWEEIEIYLFEINVAFEIIEKIKEKLEKELVRKEFTRFKLKKTINETLINEIKDILSKRESNFIDKIKLLLKEKKPIKILVIGINGSGKTTTIAKLVYKLNQENLTCVVSASDTFRAAAIEQLEEHSKKLNFKLIKHDKGSDPTAVAFDALKHAESKNKDIVIIDTAGRMANNKNLMEELKKTKRVLNPEIVLFVGDSNAGNDLIEQINLFNKELNIDGIILTKIETDEKPGSIVTTAYTIEKPIYFLGNGQNYENLIDFNSEEIAKNLFEK